MSNVIYMGIEKWQSLLNSIRQKAGIQTLLTADTAKTAVDNIPTGSSATITDAAYLFAYNARISDYNNVISIVDATTTNFGNFAQNGSSKTEFDLSGFTGKSNETFNFSRAFASNSAVQSCIFPSRRQDRQFNLMQTFENAPGLRSIDLSGMAITDLTGTFTNCSSLGSINLTGVNTAQCTSLNNTFAGNNAITELDLSDVTIGATTQMYRTFYYAKNLEKITLGENTASFGYYSNNVSGSPINRCTALKTLRIKATTPPTVPGAYVFQSSNGVCSLTNIYVPAASVADYQAASGWSTYASLISADPEE